MSSTQLLLLPRKMQQTCRQARFEELGDPRSLYVVIARRRFFRAVRCSKIGRDGASIDQEIARDIN
jgi:hypothetical protein